MAAERISGASIAYEDPESDDDVLTTTTDSSGRFEFAGQNMLGTVTVSASGYGTAYYRWPPTTSARTLRPASGSE